MEDASKVQQVKSEANTNSASPEGPYVLKISRLTVDKLGVKLYDKASAVVAELIANSYDADAETVIVRLPLSTQLTRQNKKREQVDAGYVIEVEDDGHGMTPKEAIEYYLKVGRNRREYEGQGSRSREKKRPVMGRKGIGKLAPFGICKCIEVLSAGGKKTPEGYQVTHFFMNYDEILTDSDAPVPLQPGPEDRSFRPNRGTTIRLSNFLPKRVPDEDTFHRQLAARFVFADPRFEIWIEDSRDPDQSSHTKVEPLSVPVEDATRIDLATRPVITEDEKRLCVTGWLAMAKDPYKHEEMAGVRIYARNKIVATTRDFEQPAGFTGEFTIRSYLVGEVYAEWLDPDDGEDLIRSDRQGILWDSNYGRALRNWGTALIREIGAASRKPRREKTCKRFLEASKLEEHAKARYRQQEIVDAALDLGKRIGSFAAEDELEDDVYVSDLTEVILALAPHQALIQAFQELARLVAEGNVSMENLLDLFQKTRLAELASYAQIAAERVKSIRELETLVNSTNVDEDEFQQLIAKAPWLIEPTWSVITRNQTLRTFKTGFEAFWKQRTGNDVVLDIGGYEQKRPDFTLINVGHTLHIVEIKTRGHGFADNDFDRLIAYVHGFTDFFNDCKAFSVEFPRGWRIDLVADVVAIKDRSKKLLFEKLVEDGHIERLGWQDFLTRTKNAHQMFLDVNDEYEARRLTLEDD